MHVRSCSHFQHVSKHYSHQKRIYTFVGSLLRPERFERQARTCQCVSQTICAEYLCRRGLYPRGSDPRKTPPVPRKMIHKYCIRPSKRQCDSEYHACHGHNYPRMLNLGCHTPPPFELNDLRSSTWSGLNTDRRRTEVATQRKYPTRGRDTHMFRKSEPIIGRRQPYARHATAPVKITRKSG